MLGVLANYHNDTFALDYLALITNFLHGWFNFHFLITIPFLFCSPCDSTLGEVVNGNFNRNLITGENFNIIHSKLSGNVSSNNVPVGKFNLEYGVRQRLYDRTFEFYNVVLRQNNPSLTDYSV